MASIFATTFRVATAERTVRTATQTHGGDALLAVLTAITASGSGDGPGRTGTVRTRLQDRAGVLERGRRPLPAVAAVTGAAGAATGLVALLP
ncbi:hypothetical protein [Streptomyces atratus]|uniref:hypothetical protein n=1 Tax=Streptomyces atratus TaxID=1893 RepID=UPI00224EED61|nr:hypothetical protein [Streptomyces atratus]MCX5340460.1 hypothetical protein [Streptomyces atratus]